MKPQFAPAGLAERLPLLEHQQGLRVGNEWDLECYGVRRVYVLLGSREEAGFDRFSKNFEDGRVDKGDSFARGCLRIPLFRLFKPKVRPDLDSFLDMSF